MSIGERIRALRKNRGVSLPKLAEGAGLSKGLISHLENDELANPTISTLGAIAKFFGISLAELFDGALTLQRKIADEAARSDIECFVDAVPLSGPPHGWWYDLATVREPYAQLITQAVRYLELRGLLKRHRWIKQRVRPLSLKD